MTLRPRHRSRLVVAVSVPALLLAVAGCASSRSRANEEQILRSAGLSPGERAPGSTGSQTSADTPEPIEARPLDAAAPADVRVLVGATPASGQADPDAGERPAEVDRAAIPLDEMSELAAQRTALAETGFVDAVVGQINGRPVFASEFFAPMDARLRADAARLSPAQWREQTVLLIRDAVGERMREELILAEFQAQLTPETKQGLLAFVEQLRQDIVAQNLGSESLAGRRLEETEGLTLDEKVKQERDRQIILAQLRRAVADRVYVAWREVELAYEREYDLYNPAKVARVRMIQVDGEEEVAAVRAALADNVPFAEIAREHSGFRPEEGGLWTMEIAPEGYAKTRIFAPDALNDVAVSLEPGEISEPFEWSGSTVWLMLEAIEQPPGQSLYDVQLEILNRLKNARLAEEQSEYFYRLLGRASVTDFNEMVIRLFEIAESRYLDEPTAPSGGR